MSFAGLNTANNYSFYAIPVAFGLALAPHVYAVALFNKERAPGTEEWDNCNPGRNLQRIDDAKISPAQAGKYLRAEAAQNNGFVGLPYFAAAVIAGNVARVETKVLNTVVAVYLASRAVYNYVYINNTSTAAGYTRSATWLTGIIASSVLFVQAGNRYFKGYVSY